MALVTASEETPWFTRDPSLRLSVLAGSRQQRCRVTECQSWLEGDESCMQFTWNGESARVITPWNYAPLRSFPSLPAFNE